MDVREKLVELLCQEYQYATYEDMADGMIAHGVTVQEWISVTERLPDKGEIVLACGKRHATSGMFQGALRNNPKLWNWKGNTLKEVTHWMPLPQPPKEVE